MYDGYEPNFVTVYCITYLANVADFVVPAAANVFAVYTPQTILVTLVDAGEGLWIRHLAGECTVAADNAALCANHSA